MIKTQINLYPIIYNKQYLHYQVLSDHPDKYVECYTILKDTCSIDHQINTLFEEYFDLDSSYIKFIHLSPSIANKILILPVFCLVPYLVKLKKGHLLSAHTHATHVPYIRQALNII